MSDLIQRIKEKCAGRDRWYVMNAAEDGYCMDFDWQLTADRWMADRLRENRDYIERNGYHIVKQRSLTEVEQLANEAAGALETANARIAELEASLQASRRAALEEAIRVIETYEVSVGNSAAGEIACEMTISNLSEIRDAIRALSGPTET